MADDDRTASLMTPAKLASARPRASTTPAAWLDKMAADVGHQHVSRLSELRSDLQAQSGKFDLAALDSDLVGATEALPRLDFGLVRQKRGLLARLTGKTPAVAVEFAAQYERIEDSLQGLLEQARSLHVKLGEQARNALTLLEFEVEFRALDKIIDSASRWLADMQGQLKSRSAEARDEAARLKIQQDAERCQLLVTRLKLLRALVAAAHHVHQQARTVSARRAALVQEVQSTLGSRWRDWRSRIAPLAMAAREGDAPSANANAAMDSHRELQLCMKQLCADFVQLQVHEKAFARDLQALGAQLDAAA